MEEVRHNCTSAIYYTATILPNVHLLVKLSTHECVSFAIHITWMDLQLYKNNQESNNPKAIVQLMNFDAMIMIRKAIGSKQFSNEILDN